MERRPELPRKPTLRQLTLDGGADASKHAPLVVTLIPVGMDISKHSSSRREGEHKEEGRSRRELWKY